MNDSISSLNSRLWRAARLGQVELVRELLDAGAEIDSVDSESHTAAYLAASSGHVGVIRLLAARHANFTVGSATPLDIAIAWEDTSLVITLIETNTLFSDASLCSAATLSTDVIQCLLNRGCNVAALRTRNQETPCHVAARYGSAAVIDMLINVAGVNVDARDKDGQTCCHAATIKHNEVAVRCFIAAGADVDIANSVGRTALHDACFIGTTDECAILLLAAGANVHHRDIAGSTSCLKAALARGRLVLHALLAAGADFDAPNNNGSTPRQRSEQWGFPEPTSDELALARRKIAAAQLSFVRQRAFDVCVSLQSLRFDALCMCEMLLYSCGPVARFIPFHIWWQIATTVKHFHE